MKKFIEYLTESVKTYDYRIKIAGDLDSDTLDQFEKCLAKFDVIKLTKPKKTPVQKSPAGFPELVNQSINIMDVTFNYPATPQELTELWKQCGGDPNHIRVLTTPYDDATSKLAAETETSPVLEKDFPAANADQKAASAAHADAAVIKNSAAGAKYTIAGGKTPPAETTNNLPMGVKSPIGGTNRKPVPKSNAR